MNADYKTIVLAPGESRAIHTAGRVFVCDSATDEFKLRIENQAEITAASKRVFGSSTSPQFSRVTVRNTSGSTNTIVYAISFQDIRIETNITSVVASITVAAAKNAATYTKGSSGILVAGGILNFSGVNGTDARKSFSVFNAHDTDDLYVRGANGTLMHIVPARTGYPVESGGAITLFNPGLNAITYVVCEVFYSA